MFPGTFVMVKGASLVRDKPLTVMGPTVHEMRQTSVGSDTEFKTDYPPHCHRISTNSGTSSGKVTHVDYDGDTL